MLLSKQKSEVNALEWIPIHEFEKRINNNDLRFVPDSIPRYLKVLDAIKTIPRHLFVDSGFEDHAYQDKAFPIGEGQ